MADRNPEEKVTVLLADGDPRLCLEAEAFSRLQERIELCAAVQDGERALELLQAGLRPQVLVVDSFLPGGGVLELLRRLPLVGTGYRPHVLVSLPRIEENWRDWLLTLGATGTILKPYKIPALFDSMYLLGCRPEERQPYLLHMSLQELLRALGTGIYSSGAVYLERMMQAAFAMEGPYTLGELYAQVAVQEHLSLAAIGSGISRLVARVEAAHTPARDRLCEVIGQPKERKLTNAQFVCGVTEYLRRAVNR